MVVKVPFALTLPAAVPAPAPEAVPHSAVEPLVKVVPTVLLTVFEETSKCTPFSDSSVNVLPPTNVSKTELDKFG